MSQLFIYKKLFWKLQSLHLQSTAVLGCQYNKSRSSVPVFIFFLFIIQLFTTRYTKI